MLFTQEAAPSGKNKTSAKKNVVTIIVAVLAVAAVLAAVWLYRNPPQEDDTSALGNPEELETVELARTITSIPYMSTDFDNVFTRRMRRATCSFMNSTERILSSLPRPAPWSFPCR